MANGLNPDAVKLRELMRTHDDLRKAYYNNAVVHTWFNYVEQGMCTLQEAFIGTAVRLSADNERLFGEVVQAEARAAKNG